jgi:hypothetical protein
MAASAFARASAGRSVHQHPRVLVDQPTRRSEDDPGHQDRGYCVPLLESGGNCNQPSEHGDVVVSAGIRQVGVGTARLERAPVSDQALDGRSEQARAGRRAAVRPQAPRACGDAFGQAVFAVFLEIERAVVVAAARARSSLTGAGAVGGANRRRAFFAPRPPPAPGKP